jgi:outer membrane lipoprotein carrier protein
MALLLWLSVLLHGGATSPPQVRELVRLVEKRYRSAQTLECVFFERYAENGRTVRTESGKAYFRRPGRMRWEYESPETQLFVIDGKSVWFYVPADHTVMRGAVRESSDWRTPFQLLTRNPRLSDLCKAVLPGTQEEATGAGNAVLHCVPARRGDNAKEELTLEVNTSTGDLNRVLVHEAGGVEIEFRFGEWIHNPAIPEALFQFRPPVGVAIVEAESPK